MSKKHFCTISTADHMPYVFALYDSIKQYHADVSLNVLIADAGPDSIENQNLFPQIRLYGIDELCRFGSGQRVFESYHAVCMDKFRWSMKPVFLKYLIEHADCEKLIYVDNDICFFNDYAFLFDELDSSDVILTPHWRASDPHADSTNFFTLYTSGLYNGGFVGVNKNAVKALEWWAMACQYVCEVNTARGQFVDQTHLNLLPIYFDNVKIVKHRGCNVANWNLIECTRIQKDDSVLINGTDPIVFIHFTNSTIRGIANSEDALLAPFLNEYRESLQHYGACLQGNLDGESQPVVTAAREKSFIRWVCERVRILQRIRGFLNG